MSGIQRGHLRLVTERWTGPHEPRDERQALERLSEAMRECMEHLPLASRWREPMLRAHAALARDLSSHGRAG
jgi:hypothetical protein